MTRSISECVVTGRNYVCECGRYSGKTRSIEHLRHFFCNILACNASQKNERRILLDDPHSLPRQVQDVSRHAETIIVDDADADPSAVADFLRVFLPDNEFQIVLVMSVVPAGFQETFRDHFLFERVPPHPKLPPPVYNPPEYTVTVGGGGGSATCCSHGNSRVYEPFVLHYDTGSVSEEQLQALIKTSSIPDAVCMAPGSVLITSKFSKKLPPGMILQVQSVDMRNPIVTDVCSGRQFELFRDVWKTADFDVIVHQFAVHVGLHLTESESHGLCFENQAIFFS